MTNHNFELEEGERMDQDPVLTTPKDLLKVSTSKKNFLLSITIKKNKFAINLFGWSFNSNNTFKPVLSI